MRRTTSPGTFVPFSLPSLISLFCLLVATASAASSVLGIDFGTLNLKAVLVKPGIPLEIVLSKDSKRKETAAVAFKPQRDANNNIIAEVGTFPERLYGGDALSLQGRLPGEVFPNLKPLLSGAANDDEAVKRYHDRYPAVKVERSKTLDTTTITSDAFVHEEGTWGVEELLAMEFANMKKNAERLAGKGSSVEDTVITVPAFYTGIERRAIQRAAHLAGLTVTALVSDGLAVGLDYAKSRTFPEVTAGEKAEHHIVYDMGAGSTTATVLRFQSKSVKDVGRFNKTIHEVAVLGTGWDQTLGGDGLNDVLLEEYIAKFLAKAEVKSKGTQASEIRTNGRVMSRLWRDVEKARQVLSANTETGSSFEELLPDIDFRVKISRAEFEKLASDFADRVTKPIEEALSTAKLSISDVDSIILHGGAVRTPFVQKKLEAFAGASKLKTNVNADESAVFGAAFKGAGISPSFKVKEIRDSDLAGYAAGITFKDGGKSRRQGLFTPASPVGNGAATKQITFKDKADFQFQLYQTVSGVDVPVGAVETANLTASVKELNSKFGCEKDDITTKFSIRLSAIDGLPEVIGALVSCEVEGSGKTGSVGDSVKDWLGIGKKKDQQPLQEDGTEGPTEDVAKATSAEDGKESTTSGEASSTSKAPEKPKKRTEIIPVRLIRTTAGDKQQSGDELQRVRDRLTAFDRSDRARFAREEALNVLESYTYFVRDFLSNDDYSTFSTKEQRAELSNLLDATREFMDSSAAAKAVEKELREKHSALKKLVEPVQKRKKESEKRPDTVKKLKDSLESTKKFIDMVKEQVEKAKTETSTTSGDASTTSADSLDDLEEPSDAKPSKDTASESLMPSYTLEDLTELIQSYDVASKWLEESETAQKLLKPFEDPAFVVKEIEAKASALSKATADLVYKKMKKPSSSKKPKSSKTKPSKAKTSSASAGTETPNAEEAANGDAKPKIVTMNGDDIPSEEEILKLMEEIQREKKAQEAPSPAHEEL